MMKLWRKQTCRIIFMNKSKNALDRNIKHFNTLIFLYKSYQLTATYVM